MVLAFSATLTKYLDVGPLYPKSGNEHDSCKDSWWSNLLYINNLLDWDGKPGRMVTQNPETEGIRIKKLLFYKVYACCELVLCQSDAVLHSCSFDFNTIRSTVQYCLFL